MVAEVEAEREKLMDFFDRISPLNLFPTETRGHVRAAQKEMLLAFRSIVDEAIRYVEESEKPRTKKRTKIEIQ
ncbi:MAG: hypothetical protein Q8R28_17550 [Dehalococcoidia bacterium]|nr:hypothetical protein [Dehalococcoidia bacterium]MDP2662528.1 hypothetical protein [Dehalococcoidia bacterium]